MFRRRWLVLVLSCALCLSLVAGGIAGCSRPDADTSPIVYVTATGDHYHRAGCRYLSHSSYPLTLNQAIRDGYDNCSVCRPPR
jgi:hypothetical protein